MNLQRLVLGLRPYPPAPLIHYLVLRSVWLSDSSLSEARLQSADGRNQAGDRC